MCLGKIIDQSRKKSYDLILNIKIDDIPRLKIFIAGEHSTATILWKVLKIQKLVADIGMGSSSSQVKCVFNLKQK